MLVKKKVIFGKQIYLIWLNQFGVNWSQKHKLSFCLKKTQNRDQRSTIFEGWVKKEEPIISTEAILSIYSCYS